MRVRRVAVVLNCKAGALVTCQGSEKMLRDGFADSGLEALFVVAAPGGLAESVAKAMNLKPDAIVVAGGDGTIACAASKLMYGDIPLGILPCGTMNLLAKDLSIPINDLAASIGIIAHGWTREIDVGDVNGNVFLCASMLGMPARLGRTREASRGVVWRTWARMARAVWRQLLRARRMHIALTADGRCVRAHASAITITVNPISDFDGQRFGRAELSGGCFGIYILSSFSIDTLFELLWRVLFRRRSAAVSEQIAHDIDIASSLRGMQIMNDGEIRLLAPPLHYRLHRGALRVLVPQL
jgi:diacylglycerol kinase family enzyme